MSLPLPLAYAANLFLEKFTAYNVIYTLVNGRWERSTSESVTIAGVIQTSSNRIQDFQSDGVLSDGKLLLHTRATIYIADTSQENGEQTIQTYIVYGGDTWRVNEYAVNWAKKTQGYEVYLLTKYLNIDVL